MQRFSRCQFQHGTCLFNPLEWHPKPGPQDKSILFNMTYKLLCDWASTSHFLFYTPGPAHWTTKNFLLQFVLYRMVVWISNQPPQGPSCFVSSIVKGAQCLAGYVTEVLFLLMSAFLTFQSKSPSPSNWEMFCHLHDCQVGHAFSHICISSQYEECEVQGQAEKLPLYRSCKYNLCSSLFSDFWRPVLIRAVTPLCEAVRAWERELYLPLKAWNSLDS